jgi:hypothetical protein
LGFYKVSDISFLKIPGNQEDMTLLLFLLLLLLLLYDMDVSCHRPLLPGTSPEPAVIPTAGSGFKLHTAALSVLCVMFHV